MTFTTDADQAQPGSNGPRRRIMLIAIASGVAIGGMASVGWATGGSDDGDDTTITEPVTTLEVDVTSGEVEVIGSGRDDVALEWRSRSWMFDAPAVTHEVTDGHLKVTGKCGSGFMTGGCATDVVLKVPADMKVTVVGSAGNVTAAGLDGVTDLRADAGDVRAEHQSGDITAHSSAGNVVVDGLTANTGTFTSDAGDVLLDLSEPMAELVAESSAGNVTVTVPDDGQPYAVEADTAAGTSTVDVPTDPDADRTIDASTDAGDVAVTTP